MLVGQSPQRRFFDLRSMVCTLLVAACSAQSPPTVANETSETVTRNDLMGPMRRSPEQLRDLKGMARKGNVSAMHGIAAHHLTGGEIEEARYWLGEAVRHGDCHAVQIFEETYLKMPPKDLAHWRREGQRLGCDPAKDYSKDIDKRWPAS